MPDDSWKVLVLGTNDPNEHLYVGHGSGCVMLCERGVLPRWKNALCLSSDEAERLGRQLIEQAARSRERY